MRLSYGFHATPVRSFCVSHTSHIPYCTCFFLHVAPVYYVVYTYCTAVRTREVYVIGVGIVLTHTVHWRLVLGVFVCHFAWLIPKQSGPRTLAETIMAFCPLWCCWLQQSPLPQITSSGAGRRKKKLTYVDSFRPGKLPFIRTVEVETPYPSNPKSLGRKSNPTTDYSKENFYPLYRRKAAEFLTNQGKSGARS